MDILLAFYPSEFFELVFLNDFTTLTPETGGGAGGCVAVGGCGGDEMSPA